jgi:hypothetical protein
MDQKQVLIGSDEMYQKFNKAADNPEGSICFIFGAGASFGYCDDEVDEVPPIVTDLFDDDNLIVKKVIRKPEHDFILGHRDFLLRTLKRYDNDLEKYLSALYNKNDGDDLFSSLILYLQDIFYSASDRVNPDDNNYKNLINQLFSTRAKLPWSSISFNYDTILEQSYMLAKRDKARTFESIESYLVNPKIIKIHGSINFRYLLTEPSKNHPKTEKDIFGLMMNGKKDIGESLKILNPAFHSSKKQVFFYQEPRIDRDGIRRMVDFYDFPLMMIPIHGTKRSENSLFLDMLKEAREEIEKASLVIAIGYNFGDELFTNEIKGIDTSNKELILVGTKKLTLDYKNHSAYKNILNVWKKDKIRVFEGNGFTDFIEGII